MNRLRTVVLFLAFAGASCSGPQEAEAPRATQSRQAILHLLTSEQELTDELGRFRGIVDALIAKGDEAVQVLIRTAGQPAQDQVKGFALNSRRFVPLSKEQHRSAYQFVTTFDPAHELLNVRVANLHFLFRIEGDSVVFEKSETEEIVPPPEPPEPEQELPTK